MATPVEETISQGFWQALADLLIDLRIRRSADAVDDCIQLVYQTFNQ
jgi:hypothetical protein